MKYTVEFLMNNTNLEGTTEGLYIPNPSGNNGIEIKFTEEDIKEAFNLDLTDEEFENYCNINNNDIDKHFISKNIKLINETFEELDD